MSTIPEEARRRWAELQAARQQRRLTPVERRQAAQLLREYGEALQPETKRQDEAPADDALAAVAPAAPPATEIAAAAEPAPEPNPLATAALACAIAGLLVWFVLPVALVLAILALAQIRHSRGRLAGTASAMAGLLISLVATPLLVVILVTLLSPPTEQPAPVVGGPAKAQPRPSGPQTALPASAVPTPGEGSRERLCAARIKRLSLACLQYAQDYDEQFPPQARDVFLLVRPYAKMVPDEMRCPIQGVRYVFYDQLFGRSPAELSLRSQTVMWFESEDGRTVAYPHGGFTNLGYADARVDRVARPVVDPSVGGSVR